ncbi:MAG: hypothetical protein DMD78_12715 [Candidatus Rokuibacteriota bacterium]|nr:MAG: hypothetical protein DMD78_12715 [Candidatus Rokubacteria bacterium]
MAKRRMRRTSQISTNRQSTADSLADTAKDMSVNAVKVATETAKAALGGMQELGRAMASMAAPAARRSVKTANEMTRAAIDSTRDLTRSATDTAREATRSATSPARRTTRSGASRRKSGKRRAA